MKLALYKFPGLISYREASKLQQRLVREFLSYKEDPSKHAKQPDPAIITAQFFPIYTCGRREIGTVTPEHERFLRADGRADFFEAERGGQTTFHGPGQMVAYPIIDLRRHGLSVRSYVSLLEEVTIKTCGLYNVNAVTTEHPGVWTSPEKKIASLGIHLRRNITSHGIALNVNTDLAWFDRIVACGLEGKKTTSLEAEGVEGRGVEEVTDTFVNLFARELNADGIYMPAT